MSDTNTKRPLGSLKVDPSKKRSAALRALHPIFGHPPPPARGSLPPLSGPLADKPPAQRPGTPPPSAPGNEDALRKLFSREINRPLFRVQQHLMRVTGYSPTYDPPNKEIFIEWLNTELKGAEFKNEYGGKVIDLSTKIEELKRKITELFKDKDSSLGQTQKSKLSEINQYLNGKTNVDRNATEEGLEMLVESIKSGVGDVLKEFSIGTLKETASNVKEAADFVVSSIPFAGTALALVKLVGDTVRMAKLAKNAYNIQKVLGSSFSVIEDTVTLGIKAHNKKDGLLLGKDMVGDAITAVTSMFGLGILAATGKLITNIIVTIILEITQLIQINETNKALKEGKMTVDLLDGTCSVFRLYIPHLPFLVPLTLLGVLPPGWETSDISGKIKEEIQKINNTAKKEGDVHGEEDPFKLLALDWTNSTCKYKAADSRSFLGVHFSSKLDNPWQFEFDRYHEQLKQTDFHLNKTKWRLYKKGGVQPLYEPTGNYQESKAGLKFRNMFKIS